ncbi:hypothetical protein [Bacillus sp. FSL K6-0067]|uniref:hypothetical protein n=1 Tax=Bacillus sp. FSL K6-0067 TaxID=2921412 RepID=UPI000A4D724E|nr:hypothetical protein [Bacillus cereus]
MRDKLHMVLSILFFAIPLFVLPKIFPDNQIVYWVSMIFAALVIYLTLTGSSDEEEKNK